ncbi:hypothetical protein M885DRAFT_573899 [Pelagophyceae sp. CCMP2097]|nr:hypothetical protein M885DRAFT_573899 [Pelagophyceae sp. CCMP2097]
MTQLWLAREVTSHRLDTGDAVEGIVLGDVRLVLEESGPGVGLDAPGGNSLWSARSCLREPEEVVRLAYGVVARCDESPTKSHLGVFAKILAAVNARLGVIFGHGVAAHFPHDAMPESTGENTLVSVTHAMDAAAQGLGLGRPSGAKMETAELETSHEAGGLAIATPLDSGVARRNMAGGDPLLAAIGLVPITSSHVPAVTTKVAFQLARCFVFHWGAWFV